MKNRNSKLSYILVLIIAITLIITAISDVKSNNNNSFYLYLITFASLILPFLITYICNKKEVILSKSFQSITLIIIFLAQYFGEIRKFYLKIWWWDLLIHAIFGSYVVIIAVNLIQGIIKKEHNVTNKRFLFFTLLFSFCLSITLGTLWEMFEFIGDYLFQTNMIKGGLEDTATDLIAHIIASFLTTTIIFHNFKKI